MVSNRVQRLVTLDKEIDSLAERVHVLAGELDKHTRMRGAVELHNKLEDVAFLLFELKSDRESKVIDTLQERLHAVTNELLTDVFKV